MFNQSHHSFWTALAGTCVLLAMLLSAGCASSSNRDDKSIILATTTSTQDSGLLDELVPQFERQTGIQVKVVAVGSGQALELARRGDADVLLTHAPEAELEFIAQGFGSERRPLMYNDFVLVGPATDPAHVRALSSITEAFTRVAEQQSDFVSRGDESGTHQKELAIWRAADLVPQGGWYLECGAGMGQALRIATEKSAYVLTDRATFLALREQLQLEILLQGDPLLRNDYAVVLVSREKHPHVRSELARQFADFLVAPATQQTIAEFGRADYGQSLFFPAALAPASGPEASERQ